jgi:hypothetical protein
VFIERGLISRGMTLVAGTAAAYHVFLLDGAVLNAAPRIRGLRPADRVQRRMGVSGDVRRRQRHEPFWIPSGLTNAGRVIQECLGTPPFVQDRPANRLAFFSSRSSDGSAG